ncbi:hypothetical protein CJ030_MR7G001011 [Morella rubra]|uniref:RING-type domain-containing protein n=1 Tax=Morella rubra TaxID=262757 RepID=A0A6A1V9N9_9ROSI|nr:hypothetical protein CJ030_MR7G001011 [Morella rubra]
MWDCYQQVSTGISCQDSLNALEADIQHANVLAASIPRGEGEACFQMKLMYNPLAPIFLFLLQWIDCSCACLLSSYLNFFHIVIDKACSDGKPNISSSGRRATIREFYTVILPSLQRLHGDSLELGNTRDEVHGLEMVVRKKLEYKRNLSDVDLEREDECGICLEPCTKIVLPNCCHAMCINCYHDWYSRSESCPFCRGTLKRVNSGDLWVLTRSKDVVDTQTLLKEDILRLYLFMNSLPKDIPDGLYLMHYESLL